MRLVTYFSGLVYLIGSVKLSKDRSKAATGLLLIAGALTLPNGSDSSFVSQSLA